MTAVVDLLGLRRKYHISKSAKQHVFERDDWTCQKCRAKSEPGDPTRLYRRPLGAVVFYPDPENRLTIDHIIPRILGGPNAQTNLQALCKRCNDEKGGALT